MFLSFMCISCDCRIPISYDENSTSHNIWLHINGRRHHENSCYGSSVHCLLCNESIMLSGDPTNDECRIESHNTSYYHRENVNTHYVNTHTGNDDSSSDYYNESTVSDQFNNDYDDYQDEYSDDGYDDDDDNDDYGYYDNQNNNYDNDNEDENEDGINSLFFNCCICPCPIKVSQDVQITLRQLECHITGRRHTDNVNCQGVKKSMECNVCDRPISVSIDVYSSMCNLEQHIRSCYPQ